jgi:hypothetical protein
MHGDPPTELFVRKELIALRDEAAAKNARKLAAEFNVAVREDRIHSVTVYWVDPPRVSAEHKNPLFVHVHGDAWLFGGRLGATTEAALIAAKGLRPSCSAHSPSTWTRRATAASSTTASITASPGTAMRPKR